MDMVAERVTDALIATTEKLGPKLKGESPCQAYREYMETRKKV